jgi:hypothetical protein
MRPGRLVVAVAVGAFAITGAPSASAEPLANCTSDVVDGVEVDYCVGNPNASTVSDVPGGQRGIRVRHRGRLWLWMIRSPGRLSRKRSVTARTVRT